MREIRIILQAVSEQVIFYLKSLFLSVTYFSITFSERKIQLKDIESKLQKSNEELIDAKTKIEKTKADAAQRIASLESQLAQKDKKVWLIEHDSYFMTNFYSWTKWAWSWSDIVWLNQAIRIHHLKQLFLLLN